MTAKPIGSRPAVHRRPRRRRVDRGRGPTARHRRRTDLGEEPRPDQPRRARRHSGHALDATTVAVTLAFDDDVEGHALSLHFPTAEKADEFRKRLIATGVVAGALVVGVTAAQLSTAIPAPAGRRADRRPRPGRRAGPDGGPGGAPGDGRPRCRSWSRREPVPRLGPAAGQPAHPGRGPGLRASGPKAVLVAHLADDRRDLEPGQGPGASRPRRPPTDRPASRRPSVTPSSTSRAILPARAGPSLPATDRPLTRAVRSCSADGGA